MPQSVSLFYHASIALVIVKLLFTAPLSLFHTCTSVTCTSVSYVRQLWVGAVKWLADKGVLQWGYLCRTR